MKFNWKYFVIISLVFLVAVFLRFYQLEKLPPGLIIDEASEGYNAFSILHTGKDRYGEVFPILFRSFGSFQAPVYTYLLIIPIYLFGNSIFSIHFVSAVSGIILVFTTFIFMLCLKGKKGFNLAVISAFIVAISSWAIFFSRFGTEASLGVTFTVLSFLFFYLSLRRIWLFPIATLILGLSTHAYYSDRLINPLFLISFVFMFRKILFSNKKILILGLIVFGITQIPHLMILNTGAFTRRISQVDYFNDQFFQNNSGGLRYFPFGKPLFIIREFSSQYLAYFSPKNLFFESDPQNFRSIPDLSVFYGWMIIPFIFGLRWLLINRSLPFSKMLILLTVLAPIPASLTRDPFSTIRVLVLLWGVTVVISLGVNYILNIISSIKFKILFVVIFVLVSLIQLYISYFVLLKYERSEDYGFSFIELLQKTEQMKDKKFIIDTSWLGAGIMYAYLKEYDPIVLQKILSKQVQNQYYSNFEYDEPYLLDNVEARPVFWKQDVCKQQVLVGDIIAISDEQVKEHSLSFLFDVRDMAGNLTLRAFMTHPEIKCK